MTHAEQTPWLGRGLWFLAGMAVAATGALLLHRWPADAVSSASAIPAHDTHAHPWGYLQALKIPFADPESIFADRAARMQPPHWFFEGFSAAGLAEFLRSCGLKPREQTELLDTSRWQVRSNGCLVQPSSETVRSLSALSRQQIYHVLARNPANYVQQFPFRFPLGDLDHRFTDSGLPPEKIEVLESLTYTNLGARCLADLEVLPDVLNSNEVEQALEFVYRLPAYRLRLRVYPDSDIDKLVKYWGKGGREKRIRPLLESLSRVPSTNGTSISVSGLLPPFARLRLDTFPDSWTEQQASQEDCFWTAMNFFNEQPDMRYLDPAQVRRALQTEYIPISGPPAYGDLVTVVDQGGTAVHICVYIAEDYVYTKNGRSALAPWVFMSLSDMMLFFPADPPHRIVVLRKKAES